MKYNKDIRDFVDNLKIVEPLEPRDAFLVAGRKVLHFMLKQIIKMTFAIMT